MFTGTLSPVTTRMSWSEAVEIVDDEDGEAVTLEDTDEIVLAVADRDGSVVLSASTEAGTITLVSDGIFQFAFTRDQMGALEPGTYSVGCTITRDDETAQVMLGYVPVLDGVVP